MRVEGQRGTQVPWVALYLHFPTDSLQIPTEDVKHQSHLMNTPPTPEEPSPDYSPSPPISKWREKKIPSLNTTLGEVSTCPEFQPPSGPVGSTQTRAAGTQHAEQFGLVQGWKHTLVSRSSLSKVVLLVWEMGVRKEGEVHSLEGTVGWPGQCGECGLV